MEEKKIIENEAEEIVEETTQEIVAEEVAAEETVAEETPAEETEAEKPAEESKDEPAEKSKQVRATDEKKKSIMKKKLKPLIIAGVACVVIAGLIVGAYFLFNQRENVADLPNNGNDENADIIISNKSAKLVESILVETADGTDFEIVYSNDESGTQVGTVKGDGDEFRYKSSDLYTIAGYVSYILAIEEIEDPEGRDEEFGFDEPRQEIQVNFKGNQKLELVLGGDAPSGDGIYLKRADTGRVYLIGGSTADMLMMSLVDYRDISLYDAYSTIYEINEISIKRPDEDKITIRRKEGIETNADGSPKDEYSSRYELVSPDTADAENTIVEDSVLTPFIAIASYDLVEDHPKDLEKYGLDKPTVIEVKDKYGAEHTIKVGDQSPKGGRYVMCDDVPSVIVTEDEIRFLNIKHTDFMMKLVWSMNYNDVAQITYELPDGSKSTLGLGGSTTFNGASVVYDDAVNMFMHTIQFTIQDSISSNMSVGATTHKITVTKKNGTEDTLELAPINERYYAVSINGAKAKYYVNVSQVNALESAIGIISTGGTVPSVF